MDSDLIELAAAHGVATSYRDGERKIVEVDADVVIRILGLLDVDAAEPEARMAALALARERRRWAPCRARSGTGSARSDRCPVPAC